MRRIATFVRGPVARRWQGSVAAATAPSPRAPPRRTLRVLRLLGRAAAGLWLGTVVYEATIAARVPGALNDELEAASGRALNDDVPQWSDGTGDGVTIRTQRLRRGAVDVDIAIFSPPRGVPRCAPVAINAGSIAAARPLALELARGGATVVAYTHGGLSAAPRAGAPPPHHSAAGDALGTVGEIVRCARTVAASLAAIARGGPGLSEDGPGSTSAASAALQLPPVPLLAGATPDSDGESAEFVSVLRAAGIDEPTVFVSMGYNWLATLKTAVRNSNLVASCFLVDPLIPTSSLYDIASGGVGSGTQARVTLNADGSASAEKDPLSAGGIAGVGTGLREGGGTTQSRVGSETVTAVAGAMPPFYIPLKALLTRSSIVAAENRRRAAAASSSSAGDASSVFMPLPRVKSGASASAVDRDSAARYLESLATSSTLPPSLAAGGVNNRDLADRTALSSATEARAAADFARSVLLNAAGVAEAVGARPLFGTEMLDAAYMRALVVGAACGPFGIMPPAAFIRQTAADSATSGSTPPLLANFQIVDVGSVAPLSPWQRMTVPTIWRDADLRAAYTARAMRASIVEPRAVIGGSVSTSRGDTAASTATARATEYVSQQVESLRAEAHLYACIDEAATKLQMMDGGAALLRRHSGADAAVAGVLLRSIAALETPMPRSNNRAGSSFLTPAEFEAATAGGERVPDGTRLVAPGLVKLLAEAGLQDRDAVFGGALHLQPSAQPAASPPPATWATPIALLCLGRAVAAVQVGANPLVYGKTALDERTSALMAACAVAHDKAQEALPPASTMSSLAPAGGTSATRLPRANEIYPYAATAPRRQLANADDAGAVIALSGLGDGVRALSLRARSLEAYRLPLQPWRWNLPLDILPRFARSLEAAPMSASSPLAPAAVQRAGHAGAVDLTVHARGLHLWVAANLGLPSAGVGTTTSAPAAASPPPLFPVRAIVTVLPQARLRDPEWSPVAPSWQHDIEVGADGVVWESRVTGLNLPLAAARPSPATILTRMKLMAAQDRMRAFWMSTLGSARVTVLEPETASDVSASLDAAGRNLAPRLSIVRRAIPLPFRRDATVTIGPNGSGGSITTCGPLPTLSPSALHPFTILSDALSYGPPQPHRPPVGRLAGAILDAARGGERALAKASTSR